MHHLLLACVVAHHATFRHIAVPSPQVYKRVQDNQSLIGKAVGERYELVEEFEPADAPGKSKMLGVLSSYNPAKEEKKNWWE